MPNNAFYRTKPWRHKRKDILQRDNFECQRCKEKGLVTPAYLVHHIKELEHHPELALEASNLMSLCHRCHEEIHDKFKDMHKARFINQERW